MRWVRATLLFLLSAGAAHAAPMCSAGDGDWIEQACYGDPLETGLYGHDVLGGTPEWTSVQVTLGPKGRAALGGTVYVRRVPARHIFEDIAPRIVQLDGSGPPELILIYTDFDRGAALMVDNLETGRVSVTPHIGTRNRWLAPLGAADLDGDGLVELAYVDRPHLARTLVVWRYGPDGALTRIASQTGLTSHRIGQDHITGGIVDCGQGPEIIAVNADWSTVMATRLSQGQLTSVPRGRFDPSKSLRALAGC
ncbi:VCBS repeat-containing protein [Actibacterium ureilyticum]|uniref:VCBS repeat-containing protein n=1 Tax=Actibacterium ureilyticum TaxID=1590614 RepID=UPI001FE59459|nr:VCBS repeat-containing protein [Actibacterium ureilyticum]